MVAAPILVALYDRIFLAASFRDMARRRWPLYLGLAATWLVLGTLVVTRRQPEDWIFVEGITPWTYAITQPAVIVHYLRLALLPYPLILDYGWLPVQTLSATLPSVAVVLALLALTLWALARQSWAGFWGAWFFVILAPTSSILAIADLAFEHRMYLPLAAVVVLVVVGGYGVLESVFTRWGAPELSRRRIEGIAVGVVIVILGSMTVERNTDYRSQLVMWTDVVAKRPLNPRAHNNLGSALYKEDRKDEAIAQYREAVRLKPDYGEAHRNLAIALGGQRRTEDSPCSALGGSTTRSPALVRRSG
jgi:tetratricopeptide (TPR) repeat protein